MRLVFGMIFAAGVAVGLTGCDANPVPVVSEPMEVETSSLDHGGWWCNEHGVPEEECALCKTSLIAEFKAKGDWCDKHNRPESQCFTCNPDNFGKFAARYEAKFGEQPPQPTQ